MFLFSTLKFKSFNFWPSQSHIKKIYINLKPVLANYKCIKVDHFYSILTIKAKYHAYSLCNYSVATS